jgi:hypothetical protein
VIRRRLFAVVSVVSLLLSFAMVMLWVHGLGVCWARRNSRHFSLGCSAGYVRIEEMEPWPCDLNVGPEPVWPKIPFVMDSGPLMEWRRLHIYARSGGAVVVVGADGQVLDFPMEGGGGGFSQTFGPPMPPGSSARRITRRYVEIPMWMLVGLTSLLPIAWSSDFAFPAYRLRQWTRRDFCLSCRYDLTGNTSGVCPECGTPVPKEPAEKSPRTG